MKSSKVAVKNCADTLKILADETRLMILREVKDHGKTVSEINRKLKIDQSLLSHHLKILKEAGFIASVRKGKYLIYNACPTTFVSPKSESIDLGCCTLNFN